jgi:hypothetical protein
VEALERLGFTGFVSNKSFLPLFLVPLTGLEQVKTGF